MAALSAAAYVTHSQYGTSRSAAGRSVLEAAKMWPSSTRVRRRSAPWTADWTECSPAARYPSHRGAVGTACCLDHVNARAVCRGKPLTWLLVLRNDGIKDLAGVAATPSVAPTMDIRPYPGAGPDFDLDPVRHSTPLVTSGLRWAWSQPIASEKHTRSAQQKWLVWVFPDRSGRRMSLMVGCARSPPRTPAHMAGHGTRGPSPSSRLSAA